MQQQGKTTYILACLMFFADMHLWGVLGAPKPSSSSVRRLMERVDRARRKISVAEVEIHPELAVVKLSPTGSGFRVMGQCLAPLASGLELRVLGSELLVCLGFRV